MVDQMRQEAGCDRLRCGISHLTHRGIGEVLDLGDAEPKLVQYRNSPFEKRAAVRRRLDTQSTALDQPHAEQLLHLGDRLGHGGLRQVQLLNAFAMLAQRTTVSSSRKSLSFNEFAHDQPMPGLT